MRQRSIYERRDEPKSAERLEGEIRQVRADIGETLQAIRDEVSLGAIVDQLSSYARRGPGEMAANLGRAVRDNPLPVLLTAIGAASMVMASRRPSTRPGELVAGDQPI